MAVKEAVKETAKGLSRAARDALRGPLSWIDTKGMSTEEIERTVKSWMEAGEEKAVAFGKAATRAPGALRGLSEEAKEALKGPLSWIDTKGMSTEEIERTVNSWMEAGEERAVALGKATTRAPGTAAVGAAAAGGALGTGMTWGALLAIGGASLLALAVVVGIPCYHGYSGSGGITMEECVHGYALYGQDISNGLSGAKNLATQKSGSSLLQSGITAGYNPIYFQIQSGGILAYPMGEWEIDPTAQVEAPVAAPNPMYPKL